MTTFRNLSLDTDSPSGTGFGRLRIAQNETLFESKQIFDNQPGAWDDQEVTGSGTGSTHSVDRASSVLDVSLTTAGRRVRQTYERFNYQPGKSQLSFYTFILIKSGGGTGITAGVGTYDDNNGLFIKYDQGTIKLVRRTNVTGSPVDNEVAQSSWNIDPMDGSGESGITLDFTKVQIFVVDYEWLGVGRVRFGFNIDGVTYYVHELNHANFLDSVYMSTPNLPVRYEIENDGTGVASEMEHICCSVSSEGGYQLRGSLHYASTAGSAVTCSTDNIVYAILGLRLQTAYIGETIVLIRTGIQIQTPADQIEWFLAYNPTVAGTFTYSDEPDTHVQIARGATANTVTGGTPFTGGYLESGGGGGGGAGSGDSATFNTRQLGTAIDGTRDEVVLCARVIGGTAGVEVEGSLSWAEAN